MYTFEDNLFSDLHKEVYGFRPRYHRYYEASDNEKQNIWDDLVDEMDQAVADARQVVKDAINRFEDRIADVIKIGAGDRKTALRWITSNEKFFHEQSVEHFVWEQGLLNSDYGKALIKELLDIVEYEEMEWV
tara:strand:+ start:348 stop:743 length:396 start_codon:yes stop_codon:yes gene_type:complete